MGTFSAAMADRAVISVSAITNIADSITLASQALGSIGTMVIKTGALAGGALSTQAVHTIAVETARALTDMTFFAAVTGSAGIIKDTALGIPSTAAEGDWLMVLICVGTRGVACGSCLLDVGFLKFRVHKDHGHQTQGQTDNFHCFAIEGNVHQGGNQSRRSQNQTGQKMQGIRLGSAEHAVCDAQQYNRGNRGKWQLQNFFQLFKHTDLPF